MDFVAMNYAKLFNYTDPCVKPLETANATFESLPARRGSCLFRSILPSETAVAILVCIFVTLTVFSLLINGCALLGLGRSEDPSWEPRFTLLKNLILSDLLLILTQGPTIIHCLLQRTTLPYAVWCLIQYFIDTTCIFCTMLTITCMALERYLYVCKAIHYLRLLTSRRLHLTLALIWLLSISITAVTTTLMSLGHRRALVGEPTTGLLCEPDTLELHLGFPRAVAVFRKASGLAVTVMCVLCYSFSYLRMYRDACSAVQPFQQLNLRARNTVLFYCAMLLLQLLPMLLKIATDALGELEGVVATSSAWRGALHVMLLMLLQVPPCVNPLIYGLRNHEVQRALARLLGWRAELQRTVEHGDASKRQRKGRQKRHIPNTKVEN